MFIGKDRSLWIVLAVNGTNLAIWALSSLLAHRSVAVRYIERLDLPEAIGLLLDVIALGSNQSGLDDAVV
jgi:hypothetical protein